MKKLFEQYNELVKMLKVEGAHLNHIRPEYLLSFADLNTYLGNLPPLEVQVLHAFSLENQLRALQLSLHGILDHSPLSDFQNIRPRQSYSQKL